MRNLIVEKVDKKVTAIVPTYNEAERIGSVLDILVSYPGFDQIIVVDDGSTDNTAKIVKRYPVIYIQHHINKGKAQAMETGVSKAETNVIFFCDADITGLTTKIIDEVVLPVMAGKTDMFIAMRNRKIYFLRFILFFVPLLGGERALTKDLWHKLPIYYKQRFRIETALNFYAKYFGKGFRYKVFTGVSQEIKEKKYGLLKGLAQRISMFYDILSAQARLHLVEFPTVLKKKLRL